jgi:hypothetical protein
MLTGMITAKEGTKEFMILTDRFSMLAHFYPSARKSKTSTRRKGSKENKSG